MIISICGGGSLGHTVAGYISAKKEYTVNLLTRRPQDWKKGIEVRDCRQQVFYGRFHTVTDNAGEIIPQSDMVLLCLPGFAIEDELRKIRPFLDGRQTVGSIVSSTGFFFTAHDVLPADTGLFGFQRVPFISRTSVYGEKAAILGYKKGLVLGTEKVAAPERLAACLQDMLDTPVSLAGHYLEVALSNSNPILHPSRLYSLFKDYCEGMSYPRHFLFYEDWDDESSEILTGCDREFFRIADRLPVRKGCITPLLEYYESRDISGLTAKIRSIEAFKGLKAPMKAAGDQGFVPDFNNRYFREDFPYGLSILKGLALQTGVETPYMDRILEWSRPFVP